MERRDRHNNSESTTYLNRSHPPRPQNMHRAPPPPFSVIPPPKKRGDHHALFFSANATFFFLPRQTTHPSFFVNVPLSRFFHSPTSTTRQFAPFVKKTHWLRSRPAPERIAFSRVRIYMLRTYIERRRGGGWVWEELLFSYGV